METSHTGAKRCNSSSTSQSQTHCAVCSVLQPLWRKLTILVIDDVPPGGTFEVHETGWGEFEITIKLYYIPESLEKPQTLYHHLRLHPYGETEEEKEKMKQRGEVPAVVYEEQLFNEPYENFYEILTNPAPAGKGGKTKVLKGGMVSSVGERTALIPLTNRPGSEFSLETENLLLVDIKRAATEVMRMIEETKREIVEKEAELATYKGAIQT
jgi:YEATS domain-containing protein 4